jgi:putative nucleic acid binding protein
VRCPECAADVPPLREFCPKCGTPTDPGLRESRRRAAGGRRYEELGGGGRPDDELKRNRKTVLIGAAAILGALAVAGQFNWPGRVIHFDTHNRPRGPVTIEAEQLYQAYRADPDAAAKRFKGREMVVSGEFLRIVPDGYGSLDMRLKTSNPDSQLGVDLDGTAIEDAKQLRPGQRVTVSCKGMAGSGNDRWLRDCAIQPEGSAAQAPPPAPSPPAPPPAPGGGNSG